MLPLESLFFSSKASIENWFEQQWQSIKAPFYSSTDLRYSGYKLAPVDTNLFPGGYNNLNLLSYPRAAQAAKESVLSRAPQASRILIIPENHTRNEFYLQNVACLKTILEEAGFSVRSGSLLAELVEPETLSFNNGQPLVLEPIERKENRLMVSGFDPDVILLNNDLSGGVPDILKGLSGQIQLVDLRGGWWLRRKSTHFEHYRRIAQQFAQHLNIDPWLIDPYFSVCQQIDFQQRVGVPCLSELVGDMLEKIREKYQVYGIKEDPFVILKADAGTYGMGIMAVHDVSDVINLNRKQRNKMSVIKDGVSVQEVLIQEGVRTIEEINGQTAESVIYLFGQQAVGGFYRANSIRGTAENLNASGMSFVPFGTCEAKLETPKCYANTVVARLAAMAAGAELAELTGMDAL